MRFSTRTRYGLRFLVRLSVQPSDRLTQLAQVAREENISLGYLEQIVHSLKPLQLFRVSRGVGGGYALAKKPSEIFLGDIFACLEGGLTPVACLDEKHPCERGNICSTRVFWADFERLIRRYLNSTSLQTVLDLKKYSCKEDTMWDYTQAVHEHFLHPHNAGPLSDANAIGEVGSLACGDALKLYLKISKDGIIEKAGFETFGCASAIASSSVLTDMVIGMKVDDALQVTNKDIVERLGSLPKEKMHCSVMGQEALEAAIRNWRGEPALPHAQEIGKLVCKCFGVTDAQIIRTIRENNLTTVEEVTNYTKAGGGCGDCLDEIAEILANELRLKKEENEERKETKPVLTNVQRMQKIMQVLTLEIVPTLPAGAKVELVDVDGLRVTLATSGTDQAFWENMTKRLSERVGEDLACVEAKA